MSRAFEELRPIPRPKPPADPAVDTFRQRFAPFSSDPVGDYIEQQQLLGPPKAVRPGTQERFQDPTKTITSLPPSLNAPMSRVAQTPSMSTQNTDAAESRAKGGPVKPDTPYTVGEKGPETFVPDQPGTIVPAKTADASGLPPGYSYADEGPPASPPGLPPGFSYADEALPPPSSAAAPEAGAPMLAPSASLPTKAERFLENVQPRGPISGLISLARTAGQAAQGQRPDLLTNPENAIPEAVQGGIVGMSGRARIVPGPEAPPAPPAPLRLTSRLTPEEAAGIARDQQLAARDQQLAARRQEALRVAQRLRDTGQMPAESSGAPIEMGGPVTPPEPPSPLLPAQLVKEFSAVRKGVELRDRLNPESAQNLSARDQAIEAAIRPHLKSIEAVTQRTTAPMAALEAAIPSLSEAVSTPGKAASVANWVRVYERAARAKFTPQAKSSLGLATKNLNNNLGTDLTLEDVLKGP